MKNQDAMDHQSRGSEKLWSRVFEDDAPTSESLNSAVASARSGYVIKRWWKYGQPAIDRVKALIEVPREEVGALVQDVLRSNSRGVQVTLDAFPLGMPEPDLFHVKVNFEREIRR
jgi:hypothetical protein